MAARPRYEVHRVLEGHRLRPALGLCPLALADPLGAPPPGGGTIEDRFDPYCVHLLVRDRESGDVAAACRVLTPEGARHTGRYHVEDNFDLALLRLLRGRMVEVESACVDPAHSFPVVVPLLWSALARLLLERRLDYVVSRVSLDVADGGHAAASIYRWASGRAESPEDLRVFPVRRLALDRLHGTRSASAPPLLKSFLTLGAWVCGEPALDAELRRAEVPFLLPLARMHTRYTRQFLSQAA